MSRRIKLIINPNADRGNAWLAASDLKHVVDQYGDADWAGTVYPTHATEIAKQAAEEGYDIVIALGGDGTVHEVINGLMQADVKKRPVFGVAPLGSGNDFAANLGMSDKPDVALHQLLKGEVKKIDLAKIEDEAGRSEYWNNTINMGFGGAVSLYSRRITRLRGFIMYLWAVLLTIFNSYIRLDSKIKTDRDEFQKELMMIAVNNGPREGGGFVTGPDAIMDDGELDLLVVTSVSRLMMLYMLPFFMQGTQKKFKEVETMRCKWVEIEADHPLWMHIDGEIFVGFEHDIKKVRIEILPGELEVLAPKS